MTFKKFSYDLKNSIDENLFKIINLRDKYYAKSDKSFVSESDFFVSNLIKFLCSSFYPDHVFVSEEDFDESCVWDYNGSYIFVDPIDGTENFISGLKEWGIGVSIYSGGVHQGSIIYLPELSEWYCTGMSPRTYNSRIVGFSSGLSVSDVLLQRSINLEARITGCSMYNLYNAARGSFREYENLKGVNCWDILPGLNMSLELGRDCIVNGNPYKGELLFPNSKYKVQVR